MPTCVNELAYTNSTMGVDWLHIQQIKGSRVWDIVLTAYAKIASYTPQPTSASPSGFCFDSAYELIIALMTRNDPLRHALFV